MSPISFASIWRGRRTTDLSRHQWAQMDDQSVLSSSITTSYTRCEHGRWFYHSMTLRSCISVSATILINFKRWTSLIILFLQWLTQDVRRSGSPLLITANSSTRRSRWSIWWKRQSTWVAYQQLFQLSSIVDASWSLWFVISSVSVGKTQKGAMRRKNTESAQLWVKMQRTITSVKWRRFKRWLGK